VELFKQEKTIIFVNYGPPSSLCIAHLKTELILISVFIFRIQEVGGNARDD